MEVRAVKRDDGRLHILKSDVPMWKNFQDTCKNGYYTIKVTKDKKVRSILQNAYYWGGVIPIIQEAMKEQWGEVLPVTATKEYIHELLKGRYLFYEVCIPDTGEVIKMPRSTTDLSTTEFNEYIDLCRMWAMENLGIDIPEPNQELELDL